MTLAQIMIASLDAEIEKYEVSLGSLPEPAFSSKHKKAIVNAIWIANSGMRDGRRKHRKARTIRIRRITVAALIALIAVMSSAIAFAIIYPQYYMVIKERVREWTVNFISDDDTSEATGFVVRYPSAPEGFCLSYETKEDGIYTAIYNSEAGKEIIYGQQELSEATVTGLDAENDYMKVEKINGIKTVVIKDGDCYTLFWVKDNCSFTLIGNCDLDALVECAESVN